MKRIATIEVGSFAVNCSIIEHEGKIVLIDPGAEGERIAALLDEKKLKPEAIYLTHAHFDHIGAIPFLQKKFPALKVRLHEKEVSVISHPFNQYPPEYPPVEVKNREPWKGDEAFVIETPGHTPGGVSYYFAAEKTLFSGDTLFAGAYGRTDLPGGSLPVLMESLKKLTSLPGDTEVIPGHGPFTTIATSR